MGYCPPMTWTSRGSERPRYFLIGTVKKTGPRSNIDLSVEIELLFPENFQHPFDIQWMISGLAECTQRKDGK